MRQDQEEPKEDRTPFSEDDRASDKLFDHQFEYSDHVRIQVLTDPGNTDCADLAAMANPHSGDWPIETSANCVQSGLVSSSLE